ncbi:hypothetical protein EMIHUDRAFT_257743, partial [Emiliania huxleyi CCMP1516]
GRPIEWVPPSDFERSTTKYWVKTENHLSILIMGRTPPTLAQMAAEEAPVLMHPEHHAQAIYSKFYEGTSVLSWITSLYLDSLSFRQYHERLARDDGANLFRLRWYGLDPEQAGERWSTSVTMPKRLERNTNLNPAADAAARATVPTSSL